MMMNDKKVVLTRDLLTTIEHFTVDQLIILLEYAEEMYHQSEDAYDNDFYQVVS